MCREDFVREDFVPLRILCREANVLYPTNLDAKGAKRSVKMWHSNFYKNFVKIILLYMNSGLSNIRSLHTYVMHRIFYFERYCILSNNVFDRNMIFIKAKISW